MMSFLLPLARPLPFAPRPRGRRGFSLVELLAVLLILGIMFIIGGSEISKAWKRQKVQSASGDIKVLFQRAFSEMQRRGMQTFIQVGPAVPPGAPVPGQYLPIYLIGDANGNGGIDPFANPPTALNPDLLIAEYDIVVKGLTGTKGTTGVDQEFSLSELDVTQVKSTLWSDNSTSWNNKRAIMCDFQGRAVAMGPGATPPPDLVSTGAQLAAPATLIFTHVDVVRGYLMPPTRYVLSINPLWSVRVVRQIKDASNVWVDKNG
jgi:prepilin-type N-terminal cleavage/methylation domain-containing protein